MFKEKVSADESTMKAVLMEMWLLVECLWQRESHCWALLQVHEFILMVALQGKQHVPQVMGLHGAVNDRSPP